MNAALVYSVSLTDSRACSPLLVDEKRQIRHNSIKLDSGANLQNLTHLLSRIYIAVIVTIPI